MRLGMIVRGDMRGLQAQTRAFHDHLKPDVTVAVDISPIDPQGKWVQDFTGYPQAIISPWAGYTAPLSDEAVEALSGCDVVYTAETVYDPRLLDLCRMVIHVNPELHHPEETAKAAAVWVPTEWLIDQIPRAEVVPVPAPEYQDISGDRWLHVQGHAALGDRNGTNPTMWAAHRVGPSWRFTSLDGLRGFGTRMEVLGPTDDWRDLYRGCRLLVLPRRYGGLSLPVQEALSCGLAVAMTDTPPNRMWPIIPIPIRRGGRVATLAGPIDAVNADPRRMVNVLQSLTDETIEEHRRKGREWVEANGWDIWASKIRAKLEAV